MVAEIGDVKRFGTSAQLCSWAGLTPKHRESDTTVRRGRISKQGSRLLRWAAIEAACPRGAAELQWLHQWGAQLAKRRNNKLIARTAMARKILVLVFYGMRDGHIRCLAQPSQAR
jgi:transposase